MMAVDQNKISVEWEQRGFSCDLWKEPPGQTWEDYVHDVDELVMVVAGKLEVEMQGQTFHPQCGEEIFIPKNVHHSVRNIGGTAAHWLYGYKRKGAV